MSSNQRISDAIFGALVADAAALGLHWIYDEGRIANIVKNQHGFAFLEPDPANYEGVPAYFAHVTRKAGQGSQYGAALVGALEYLAQDGRSADAKGYQTSFISRFGPGGSFNGYIDRPTRDALTKITAEDTAPSGGEDNQLPALSAVLAAHHLGDELWKPLQSVTHANPVALAAGTLLVKLLSDLDTGGNVQDALRRSADQAPEPFKGGLRAALQADTSDSVVYGGTTGRACYLTEGLPLAFHILHNASDYTDAVRRNILAGGDSCGRALVIGAVMGAAHGVSDIPLDWVLRLEDGRRLWALCQEVSTL
ncbi:ADP-ribosylglycohydrolase family protein [Aliiroseovarius sp. 2305UL8-7]|uniref:ADP-ribosylglycohydrolase family protein n=1 Tax=Aliiroseovarius conchicola TaxID=3121637 RepID=UPI0035284205